MNQGSESPVQLDFFDETEWESPECRRRRVAELLDKMFGRLKSDLEKTRNPYSGGVIVERCGHCGGVGRDHWGFCTQCGKSPYIFYKKTGT